MRHPESRTLPAGTCCAWQDTHGSYPRPRIPPCCCYPFPWLLPRRKQGCGSAPGSQGGRSVSLLGGTTRALCSRDTNHERTWALPGVRSVPHLLPIIAQTEGRRQRGRSPGSLTPLRAECLALARIQPYYQPPELLISWISVMSGGAFTELKRAGGWI